MKKTEKINPILDDDYFPEAALAISPRTARLYRQRGQGPPWIKVFGKVYYPKEEFRAWLKSQHRKPGVRRRRV